MLSWRGCCAHNLEKSFMSKKSEPPILKTLAELNQQERPKIKPAYPFDPKTDEIHLPDEIVADLKFLLLAGNKVAAIKRVAELTGAGLRLSKDYVDALERQVVT
jgi:ribosomal protein L7/L12